MKNIKVEQSGGKLRIFIDDLMHLMIEEVDNPIMTIQTYLWPCKREYWIEYWLKDGKLVKTLYHSKPMWVEIIKQLQEIYK